MNTKEPSLRMYVDENGHQTLKGDLSNSNNRFLCLTGVMMRLKEHDILSAALDKLKMDYFGTKDIVLHRRELISAERPFINLSDPVVRERFNTSFLEIARQCEYRVVSVVIDKKALVERYGVLRARDPYAIALEDLMQRYQFWMQSYCSKFGHCYGDILAEARGGNEDKVTKNTYIEIYNGNGYNPLKNAAKHFSSTEIKLKPKSAGIAGLEFTDLISHPARRYILSRFGLAENIKKSSYEQKIVDILVAAKFRRRDGEIDGHGIRLFPQ